MDLKNKFEEALVFTLSKELHNEKCVKIANDYAIEFYKIKQNQILDFLHSEITERRDYSSSKMCEEVIKFIEELEKN